MKKLGIILAIIFVLAIAAYLIMQSNWYKKMQITTNINELDQIKIVEFDTNLPEVMPEDIVIHYEMNEGIYNYSNTIRITPKEQTFSWTREGKEFNKGGGTEGTLDMNLSSEEMEKIYMQLRRYGFDMIKEVDAENITYDGGESRIYMTYFIDGEEYNFDVTQGETTYVSKDTKPQWNVSVQLFEDLIEIYNK